MGPSSIYYDSNAIDNNMETCMRTRDIGQSSVDKSVWWRVDLGRVYNIYRISIMFNNYKYSGLLHSLQQLTRHVCNVFIGF